MIQRRSRVEVAQVPHAHVPPKVRALIYEVGLERPANASRELLNGSGLISEVFRDVRILHAEK